MPDSNTVLWCGLAAHGAAWCDAGRRAAAAGVHGRASGIMRVCNSASGSARRAGVRTYFIIIIVFCYDNVEHFMREDAMDRKVVEINML